jgi:dienelactone hydrolase
MIAAMPTTLALLLALLAAGATSASAAEPVRDLADGRAGVVHFESVTPAGYFALARRDAKPTTIVGTLRLPDGAGRVPAVVLSHGSAGVTNDREFAWADRLTAQGVAAFVVDSFAPRGIDSTANDQSQLSTAANVADALAALRLLVTHPRIDAKKIGVMGFSKGGQVALYTALEPFRRAVIAGDARFAAHAAFYPYCNDWEVSAKITGAPMLFLLGGADDYTPAGPCRDYAKWFADKGADTTVVVYRTAYHGFDGSRTPEYARSVVTGRDCDMMVDLDRFVVTSRKTGEDITKTAAAYARKCLSRGATIGGDSEARRRAPADLKAFLEKAFGQ